MADTINYDKRRFLTNATAIVGAAGALTATVPFMSSLSPSAKAEAAGAPVEVDISKLAQGQLITVEWRGKPVWVFRRSETALADLVTLNSVLQDPASENASQQPEYCQNKTRSIREEIMVLVGVCTHLGCSPTYRPDLAPADLGADWKGGFFCPCHGSKFDLAGRVFENLPAPTNLLVPPYHFISDNQILIGVDKQGTA